MEWDENAVESIDMLKNVIAWIEQFWKTCFGIGVWHLVELLTSINMEGEIMTITLKIMSSDEFQEYLDYAIENFAYEQVKSGNWKKSDAINKAREEHKRLLPDGANTKNHYLFTIRDGDLKVGMVWLAKKDDNKGFIYDINIWKSNQGKGYGKQAMKKVEIIAKEIGMKMIGLNVFGHNKVAKELYENLGYIETNIKMEKLL